MVYRLHRYKRKSSQVTPEAKRKSAIFRGSSLSRQSCCQHEANSSESQYCYLKKSSLDRCFLSDSDSYSFSISDKILTNVKASLPSESESNSLILNPVECCLTCSICFEKSPKTIGELSFCFHQFCFECIQKWSCITNTCPLCNANFNSIQKCILNDSEKYVFEGEPFPVDAKDLRSTNLEVCSICLLDLNQRSETCICSGCLSYYHVECVNPSGQISPDWICQNCETGLTVSSNMMYVVILVPQRSSSSVLENRTFIVFAARVNRP